MNKTVKKFLIVLGIVLTVYIIFLSEKNILTNKQAKEEMSQQLIEVDATAINLENEGKLISTNGQIEVEKEIVDKEFGVRIKTPKLERIVEMYQWEEYENKDNDGNTTYSYSKVWSEELINSNFFHERRLYENPDEFPIRSQTFYADRVKVGDYYLEREMINELPTKAIYTDFSDEVAKKLDMSILGDYYTTELFPLPAVIGDIRVSFKYNDYTDVSIIGKQLDNSITTYKTNSGKEILHIEKGIIDGNKMISKVQTNDVLIGWLCRVAGIAALFACVSFFRGKG